MRLMFTGVLVASLAASAPGGSAPPPELASQAWAVTEAVLAHHVDPPTRQQMLLGGLKAVYRVGDQPPPRALGRAASGVVDRDGFAEAIARCWPRSVDSAARVDFTVVFLEGMLAEASGGSSYVPPQDLRVEEQTAGNRYVGVHIAVDVDAASKCVRLNKVMPGGPADVAGLKDGDLFEAVDGVDVRGHPIREVVDRLRGEEGSAVSVAMRRPATHALVVVTMVRRPLFQPTITGVKSKGERDWEVRLDGPDAVGYLRVGSILASTPRELREMARRVDTAHLERLVIDLRGAQGDDPRMAAMLADELLESGLIGRVRTLDSETTVKASPDAVLRGVKIAVLVDQGTQGVAEWLAGALQDNHRAIVVGGETRGRGAVHTLVPLEKGMGGVKLASTLLLRGDGLSKSQPPKAFQDALYALIEREASPVSALDTPENVLTPDRMVKPPTSFRRNPTPDLARDPAVRMAIEALR
jgi:carboxyl-terminal processing protease